MPSRFGRAVLAALVTAGASTVAVAEPITAAAPSTAYTEILPAPVSAGAERGGFTIDRHTTITAGPGAQGVADYLAGILRHSTGQPLPIVRPSRGGNTISLITGGSNAPSESYRLDVSGRGVTLTAGRANGLFAGVQTLRQIVNGHVIPAGHVADAPRFAYRGAMLDVARHFFTMAQVERYIDQLVQYKINTLHLHLADDQGWRLMINSWPRLATYGGSTAVDGDPGGYYTQAQYRAIIQYAASRYVTVIPEIDMPGHVNAALASYAELNCDGVAPPLYTGTDVGFSSLCVHKDVTYTFLDDVIGELAALTPGAYLHIGGDEAHATSQADYIAFMNRVQGIVAAHGKRVQAWHQIAAATPLAGTVAQYWGTTNDSPAGASGVVLSPANLAYLDMKYNGSTPLGQDWAALIEVRDAYGWDPGTYLPGAPSSAIRGVEAPLWTETLRTSADLEYMAFPRLPAIAELGWSPASTHNWDAFELRLAAQAPRWRAEGINFYPSPQIPWR
ncbi:beta-N-acetylhexosaminidase [Dactylosporangium sp. CS-033363]|uniref:beta-N-acetylhexosaminidase n=1 Tax=Dactylosporangium sp. CS-033363 TaxID=3239935 RepID=UPI003D8B70A0